MLGFSRFFLPGTMRFVAMGTIASFSAAMSPTAALAQPGTNATTVAATASTEVASNVAGADIRTADTSAAKSDPRYRNLFARWKSVEVAQELPQRAAGGDGTRQ